MRWAASPTDGRRLSEGKRSRSWLRLRELPLRVSQPSTPSDLKSHESSRTCHIGQNPMRAIFKRFVAHKRTDEWPVLSPISRYNLKRMQQLSIILLRWHRTRYAPDQHTQHLSSWAQHSFALVPLHWSSPWCTVLKPLL